jgi:hypothetical protein
MTLVEINVTSLIPRAITVEALQLAGAQDKVVLQVLQVTVLIL